MRQILGSPKYIRTQNEFLKELLEGYNRPPLVVERLVEKSLTENQFLIDMPPWVKVLLQATTERLSRKYNKVISPDKLLMYIFMRYTVEKYSEWFYPFVINPIEMERLTGYKIENLRLRVKGLM